MRKVKLLLLAWISWLAVDGQNVAVKKLIDEVSEASLRLNLYNIASDEFQGRMAASKGDDLAIQYIENWFGAYHLEKPFHTSDAYLQTVPLVHAGYSGSSLAIEGEAFELDKDWTYALVPKRLRKTEAEVVFVGYGLSLPDYDDFKNIDVEGKIVLFKAGMPTDGVGKPLINPGEMPDIATYANTIWSKKPLCVLHYSPGPISASKKARAFQPYIDYRFIGLFKFPRANISMQIADKIIGGNSDSVYAIMEQSGKPYSFNTHKHATIALVGEDAQASSKNIIGIIKGTDPRLPCVVVSAHHDHEGVVDGKTYYGADDDGSGTVGLMEIAKVLGEAAAKNMRSKRTIVFLSTAAEEQGLIGSGYYVDHPVIPLSKTYCDINMDMIGRVDSLYSGKKADSNYVYAICADPIYKKMTLERLAPINNSCCRLLLDTLYEAQSKSMAINSVLAESDQYPFLKQGIPAVFFFSGFHKDWHQPTDTPDKINYPLYRRRVQLVLATVWQLANE